MLPFRKFASTRAIHSLPRLTGIARPDSNVQRSVIQALRSFPNGASTKDIYDATRPRVAGASGSTVSKSTAPEHPYKSIKHLKKTILASLYKDDMIQKVHIPIAPEAVGSRSAAANAPSKQKRKTQARKGAWIWRVQEENVPRSFLTGSPPDSSAQPLASRTSRLEA